MLEKIQVIGEDDIVLMFGLLGIEGTIIGVEDTFIDKFNDLIEDESIGMIIVGLPLSPEEYDFLLDFKLYTKEPFVFILPDLFQIDFERKDVIKNKILEAIGDIIS